MEKKPVKIVTIGGGSSYTPELMEGFIKRYEELPIKEIWLVDIEDGREKLEIVGAMAQRMWDATPYGVKVHLTLDRREDTPRCRFRYDTVPCWFIRCTYQGRKNSFLSWYVRSGDEWCRRYVQSFPYDPSYP